MQLVVGHLGLGGMRAGGHLGAGPLRQLTAGRRRLAKDLRDLVEGELEDVVQYEGDPFGRAEPLQQDQQGFAHLLVQGHPVRGIDHRLPAEAERTVQPCGIARPLPPGYARSGSGPGRAGSSPRSASREDPAPRRVRPGPGVGTPPGPRLRPHRYRPASDRRGRSGTPGRLATPPRRGHLRPRDRSSQRPAPSRSPSYTSGRDSTSHRDRHAAGDLRPLWSTYHLSALSLSCGRLRPLLRHATSKELT